MRVFTKKAVTALDQEAISTFHIPSIVLMENASLGAANFIYHQQGSDHVALVICGSGNNGGDGYATARHLYNFGLDVRIAVVQSPTARDAQINASICKEMGIPINAWNDESLSGCTLIIDAIFGTGLSRPVEGEAQRVIQKINDLQTLIVALDIPSGLDCDSGNPLGACVKANQTITFVGIKSGFLQDCAQEYIGEVAIVGIGCPRSLIEKYGIPAIEYDG